MTLLDFFRSCPGMEKILTVEEYSGQLVVYADATRTKDIPYKCDYFSAIMQRFLPEHFGSFEDTEYLDEDTIKVLTEIQVNIDDDELYTFDSLLKYPHYQAIGRVEERDTSAELNLYHFNGIINEAGSVRSNSCTGEYPNTAELLSEALDLILAYQKIDIIIAITYWTREDNVLDWYDKERFMFTSAEYSSFTNELQLGFWIHDKTIDILGRAKTIKVLEKSKKQHYVKDVV